MQQVQSQRRSKKIDVDLGTLAKIHQNTTPGLVLNVLPRRSGLESSSDSYTLSLKLHCNRVARPGTVHVHAVAPATVWADASLGHVVRPHMVV